MEKVIKLPKLRKGQAAIIDAVQTKKYVVCLMGRRAGKSVACAVAAIREAIAGGHCVVTGPSYSQVRLIYDEVQRSTADIAEFSLTRMEIKFPEAGKITFRSLDMESAPHARGLSASALVIDEAAYIPDGYRIYHEILRPIIADRTDAWVLIVSTPAGQQNWVTREWRAAQDDPNSAALQAPTLGCEVVDGQLVRKPHPYENEDFPWESAVELWKKTPSQIWASEFMATPTDESGSVFRGLDKVATAVPQQSAIPGHSYVMAIDWATGHGKDFTAVCVLDLDERAAAFVDRFQGTYSLQLERIKDIESRFHPGEVLAEQNSLGDPLIAQLQNDGLIVTPVVTTSKSKTEMVENLVLLVERESIRLIPGPLVEELRSIQAMRLPSSAVRYSAPPDLNDDLATACWIAATRLSPAFVDMRIFGGIDIPTTDARFVEFEGQTYVFETVDGKPTMTPLNDLDWNEETGEYEGESDEGIL